MELSEYSELRKELDNTLAAINRERGRKEQEISDLKQQLEECQDAYKELLSLQARHYEERNHYREQCHDLMNERVDLANERDDLRAHADALAGALEIAVCAIESEFEVRGPDGEVDIAAVMLEDYEKMMNALSAYRNREE